ncbi:MAG: hypothetical protein IIW92_12665 [Lachnospiraceae bacterium]|nr:hypothetical protein [Lachnospiraceae bacterium]MBQ5919407.1 hypothetical protein [Lachnospiraceae bacterium]
MWETAYSMIKYVNQYVECTDRVGLLYKIEIKDSNTIIYYEWSPLGPYTITLTITGYDNIYYINDELLVI